MISFFIKNNEKKRERKIELEIELTERSAILILPLMDSIFSPPIVDNFARIPSSDFLPDNTIQHYIPTHLNIQPVSTLLPALNYIAHTNNRLNMTIREDFFLRKSSLHKIIELHKIINEQLLATLFAIKSVTKKLPIHFVIEIARYLFQELTILQIKQLCTEILNTNETEPPPHPNYILR